MSARIRVRSAESADATELIKLMRELATFEGYLDQFTITAAELLSRGFPKKGTPQFFALIAESPLRGSVGYAVYHLVSFTFDLRPTLVLKELFVQANDRGKGTGRLLLDGVLTAARKRGCGKITWAVLPSNRRAKSFYRAWGGRPDHVWEFWTRPVEAELTKSI